MFYCVTWYNDQVGIMIKLGTYFGWICNQQVLTRRMMPSVVGLSLLYYAFEISYYAFEQHSKISLVLFHLCSKYAHINFPLDCSIRVPKTSWSISTCNDCSIRVYQSFLHK